MKVVKYMILGFIVVLLGTQFAAAQTDIISAADLSKKIKAKEKITIISARKEADYKKAHLKNAIHIDLKKMVSDTDPKGVLKSPDELAKYLGSKGIDGSGLIVIYDDGKMKYAGRTYWIFKYLGVENVKVLHRDLKKWQPARLMVTKSPTKIVAKTFTPKIDKSIFVDLAWMKAHYKDANVVLVDVRPPDEFHGTSTKPESKGHIPGAKNMEFTKVLKENGNMKPKAEIQALADGVGATADKTIILYCGTSTRAGIVFLAFKNILGLPDVKVYEGAYNEWVIDNPVEK
jgi:thiosulfate/3-mercaptopyruvate sulfurtransferase